MVQSRNGGASIIIPVFNRLAFTRQCLDRIARHTTDVAHEVIIVDNGSTDGTQSYFSQAAAATGLTYLRNERNLGFARANNLGARLAKYDHLLFLNNDTLVAPGWLGEMMALARSDARVGIVGIKQLFPYTRTVYHTGIVFTRGPRPIHLYPYADGDAVHVNRQREYQAVNGACLLIGAELFAACGGFDEGYVNGYEDVDLCLAVRQRGLKVVCCTRAYIYHYAQISEGRTADDERNLARLVSKRRDAIRVDEDAYFRQDARDIARSSHDPGQAHPARVASPDHGVSSPFWRGMRISVIVPVGDRGECLPAQLRALASQTILAEEFEAIVVDYGSGPAPHAVELGLPYAVHYHRCREGSRAGDARNAGVSYARGDLILFLGEGCVPGERLLEEQLLTHAREPDPRIAVVGRLEWSGPSANGTLLQEVCVPRAHVLDSAVESGTTGAELTRLDVGNASFKRTFLAEAWASGIRFDPNLTLTSFQGADLAVRLQARGLRVRDAPNARAYQNPPEHVESLLSRDDAAGADAVTLSRAHPALAPALDVAWISTSEESARRLARHPQLRQAIADFGARTDELIVGFVESLDELTRLEREPSAEPAASGIGNQRLLGATQATVGLAREVRRTKGKVRAWFGHAPDPELANAADPLMAATRAIEWLAAPAGDRARIAAASGSDETVALPGNKLEGPERGIVTRHELPRAYAPGADAIRRMVIIAVSRSGMKSRLRAVDALIEARLRQRRNAWWLERYLALRARLRPFVV